MEYRRQTHAERGFETEVDELESLHDYVQAMMEVSEDPAELVDSLLIMANVCEARALLLGANPKAADWYIKTGKAMRDLVETLSAGPHKPKEILEHPYLYYPNIDKVH